MNSISQAFQQLSTDLSTDRKVSPLAREIGVSRKRLARFLASEVPVGQLTVEEYKKIKAHTLFTNVIEDITDLHQLPEMEHLAIYKVKFYPEKIKEGLEIFWNYIRPGVNILKGRSCVPFGDSSFHLMILTEIESIATKHADSVGANQDGSHWPLSVNEQQQKIWLEECIKAAGSEENFRSIWKEWNLNCIQRVKINFHSLNFEPKKVPGQTELIFS